MTDAPRAEWFTERYLDPASRLGEILFGLIMVLSVTLTEWVQYAHTNRIVAGLVMVGIGLALVGVAVLLGG